MKDFEIAEQIITRETEPLDNPPQKDVEAQAEAASKEEDVKTSEPVESAQEPDMSQSKTNREKDGNESNSLNGKINPAFLSWWDDVVEVDRED